MSYANLGIAIRYLCAGIWISSNLDDSNDRCLLPSTILQFFEMASEGWFLSIVLDIRYAILNPFINYKKTMPVYVINNFYKSKYHVYMCMCPIGTTRSHGVWD